MAIRLVRKQLSHAVYLLVTAYVATLMMIGGVQILVAWQEHGSLETNVMLALEWLAFPALVAVVPAAWISSFLFGPGSWFAGRGVGWSAWGSGAVGAGVIGLLLSPSALMLVGGLIGCGAGWISHDRPRLWSVRWWGGVLATALLATVAAWILHPLSGWRS